MSKIRGTIRLNSEGNIIPRKGDTDQIDLNLYVGDTLISYGNFEKLYFDYTIHEDEGYAMPEQLDDLYVSITELSEAAVNKVTSDIQILNNIIQILEGNFANILE